MRGRQHLVFIKIQLLYFSLIIIAFCTTEQFESDSKVRPKKVKKKTPAQEQQKTVKSHTLCTCDFFRSERLIGHRVVFIAP
jgi:hypothetical protein